MSLIIDYKEYIKTNLISFILVNFNFIKFKTIISYFLIFNKNSI
jgi:hypothetical protein